MLTDEKVIDYLYNNQFSYLTITYQLVSGELLRSELYNGQNKVEDVSINDAEKLTILNLVIERTEKEDNLNKVVVVEYVLPSTAIAMLQTVRKFGVLKLKNNHQLNFLDLAKTAVILSHVGKGMVDFNYNGIEHTVRMRTKYSYFVEQDKLSKEL